MRSAGLSASSYYGPNDPMARFNATWVDTGVWAIGAALRMRSVATMWGSVILPELPPGGDLCTPLLRGDSWHSCGPFYFSRGHLESTRQRLWGGIKRPL